MICISKLPHLRQDQENQQFENRKDSTINYEIYLFKKISLLSNLSCFYYLATMSLAVLMSDRDFYVASSFPMELKDDERPKPPCNSPSNHHRDRTSTVLW